MVLVTAMAAPLAGVRVLEVANWPAVPAAGALLGELGVSNEEIGRLATDGVI